jgi:hypothetical protein
MTNVETLFEPRIPPRPYETLEAELAAVADGAKRLSYFELSLSETAGPGENEAYSRVRATAHARGLSVVLLPSTEIVGAARFERVRVFVSRLEESWRILALQSLWQALDREPGWSYLIERYTASLLGYTDEQITEWLVFQRRYSPAFGCVPLYLLFSVRDTDAFDDVGWRCIPKTIGDVELIRAGVDLCPRWDLATRVPSTTGFVRFGVAPAAPKLIFGSAAIEKLGVERLVLNPSMVRSINQNLVTPLERIVPAR